MVSKQVEPLTMTALLVHMREQLLDTLSQPLSAHNNAVLTNLWRTCLTVHDLAEERQHRSYVRLMEKMIDAIADYHDLEHPEAVNWAAELPSTDDIEQAEIV